ncbi:MAG: SRPBCC family protein [Phycisphaerae bacterium]
MIHRTIGEVFAFFAEAGNLDRLTPPQLRFRILNPMPVVMEKGVLLNYRLRLHGVPFCWQSEITVWEPPHRFVDEQRKGPYRRWTHEHLFREKDRGTEVIDRVEYEVPGGRLVHRLFVKRDVTSIFQYRRRKLTEIFHGSERPSAWLEPQHPSLLQPGRSRPGS